jgi:transposase
MPLPDEEWDRLVPLSAHPRQGHRWNDHRTVIDGQPVRTRTGCPWRDLPPEFGLTTKIHRAAGRRCRPVTQILGPGQHGDCPRFIPLMDQIRILRCGTGDERQPAPRLASRRIPSSPAHH